VLLPEEVAHFAPIPDPQARFRGMSWLTPVIRRSWATRRRRAQAAVLRERRDAEPDRQARPDVSRQAFESWTKLFEEKYGGGVGNAYKTMYLGGGADATVVGADLKQLDFKVTQGAGETRIAAAAGVPPVIVGLSEGLQAATYSNYSQARRRFADGTMRPLWRNGRRVARERRERARGRRALVRRPRHRVPAGRPGRQGGRPAEAGDLDQDARRRRLRRRQRRRRPSTATT
jgi:hypothetical protein